MGVIMASYVKFKFLFLGVILAAALLLPGEIVRGSEPAVLEVKEPVSTSPSKLFTVVLQGAWGKEEGQFGKVDEASRPARWISRWSAMNCSFSIQ